MAESFGASGVSGRVAAGNPLTESSRLTRADFDPPSPPPTMSPCPSEAGGRWEELFLVSGVSPVSRRHNKVKKKAVGWEGCARRQ